ncbi:MFS transporter [Marinomonas agarivorans]|nr:MFS transporter [Marinomonas agarivorans]
MKEISRTALYCLMILTVGMVSGSLGPSLVYLSDLVDASVSQISIVFTVKALGSILGAYIAGRAFDRFSGHMYLLIMACIVVVTLFLVPFSNGLVILSIIFFIMGFAEVSMNTGCNLLTIWVNKDKAGTAMLMVQLAYSVGTMIAPLILVFGGWLGGDYGTGYWLIALYTLIFPFVLWRSPSPTYREANTDGQPQVFNKAFFTCFLFMVFMYVGFEVSVAGWISTYAKLNGMPQTEAALLVTLFFLAFAAGRLLSVPILRWVSLPLIMAFLLAMSVAGSVLIAFSILPITVVALLLGAGCSAVFPMLFTFGNEVVALTGKLTGYIFTFCGVGAMVMPSAIGPLIDWYGASIYPYVLIIMSLILWASWLSLQKLANTNKKPQPQTKDETN